MGNLICKVWAVVSAACLFASCSSSIPQTTRQPAQAQTAPGKVKGIQQKCPQNNDPQPEYPNPQVTMGVVRAESTRDEICTPHFTEGLRAGKPTGPGDAAPAENNDEIAVTDGEKKIVFEKYLGAVPENPSLYEIDHLISLQLGGSNDIRNLWPQHYCPYPGAKEKDVVETALKNGVCKATPDYTMEEAQRIITTDWYACYKEIKAGNKCPVPSSGHFITVSDQDLIRAYP